MSDSTAPEQFEFNHDEAATSTVLDLPAPTGGGNNNLIRGANSHSIRGANKPRMSFADAEAMIVESEKGLTYHKVPLSDTKVVGGRFLAKDRELNLDTEGLKRLCGHLHAPVDYLDRLSPKLRDENLTFNLALLGRETIGLNDHNSHVMHRDNRFIGLSRSDLHRLESREVLNAVRDGFGDADSFEVQNITVGDDGFEIDIVSPRVGTEVRKGDLIEAGVRLQHFYSGERATTLVAFLVRLACTNGNTYRECLVARDTPRTRRLPAERDDASILQIKQIEGLAKNVRKSLEPTLDAIKQLAVRPVEFDDIDKFLRLARMHSAHLRWRLKNAWEDEGAEKTAFGLFNAMTRLATHGGDASLLRVPKEGEIKEVVLSRRQMAALERLAGIYANQSNHAVCPRCRRSIHNNLPS